MFLFFITVAEQAVASRQLRVLHSGAGAARGLATNSFAPGAGSPQPNTVALRDGRTAKAYNLFAFQQGPQAAGQQQGVSSRASPDQDLQ